jgi:hypothetical protein
VAISTNILYAVCSVALCSTCRIIHDGISFLNVPYWSDNTTELYSVTVVSNPCRAAEAVQHDTFKDVALAMANSRGCNVRFETNETLVATLRRDAAIETSQPLLVRILSNVSLGLNLDRPIVFRRPVLLLGTSSVPVSVDLGMVVNQLDTSALSGQLAWQALVLENLAPGALSQCDRHRVTISIHHRVSDAAVDCRTL